MTKESNVNVLPLSMEGTFIGTFCPKEGGGGGGRGREGGMERFINTLLLFLKILYLSQSKNKWI